jgi:hypothetical protein
MVKAAESYLLQHQQDALKALVKWFDGEKTKQQVASIILPTGTGKSYILLLAPYYLKYFNTFPNPNPTWCSAPYTQDYQFKLSVCAPNPLDSSSFIKIDACTSDAAAPPRVYVLLFVIAMILSCFVV